ncbi:MAG TPA: DsbA family protein, partial [Motiliproteus sp.]
YQDHAFAQQSSLSEQSAREIAAALNLNLSDFDRCVADNATAAKVKRAEQQAIAAGATGTPTFFLNGQKLHLHDSAAELPKLLEQALGSSH